MKEEHKMLKVVLCIPTLATAGAEKFVVDLAINLDRRSTDVCIVITRKNVIGAYGELLKKNNIKIVDLSDDNILKMFYNQYKFLSTYRPDIVHTNIGSLLHIMFVTKLLGIKGRIYTVHNEAKLLYGNSSLRKLVYKLAFSYFDFKPVAICENIKESFIKSFGSKYMDMSIVNNGVDIFKFKPVQNKKQRNKVKIINTGTMYYIKNQIELLKAFSIVTKKYDNLSLTILGDGEDRCKLEKFVEDEGLSDKVFMPGICKNVDEYLSDSDIYISTSLTEGLPLSMLEAMASGLPVISSNVGGCNDLVKHGENGFIYKINEIDSLVEYMEKLINDRTLRNELSRNSRKIAEVWSIKNCAGAYNEMYKILSE